MPKARKRKKETGKRNAGGAPTSLKQTIKPVATTETQIRNRRALSSGVLGPQSLFMPGMVALGCWGLAFSFLVFSNDPDHILFGGMAVLMALLWSFSVFIRVRKLLLLRQKS